MMASIRLPENFDRQSIEGLVTLLRTSIDSADGVESVILDGADVERIGQVGLQLLLSASRTASERGVALRIASPSASLREAAELTALVDMLPLDIAA